MEKLRFGICGLGFMGRTHFARLRSHPHAEVVALCDRDERRRRGDWNDALGNLDLVQLHGGTVPLDDVATYASAEELIDDPRVDVVLVALPTPLHAQVTVAALEAGKHVLCEKPMAPHPNDCNRMVAASQASGRTLMVAQCIRFWPQYEVIQQYVNERRIGGVQFISLRRVASPPTYSAEGWLLDGVRSGGAILDLHVHDVDFAHHLLGVPGKIAARGRRGPSGGIDHVVATYAYSDGRYAVLEGGWTFAAPRPFEMAIIVNGEHGTLEWSSLAGSDVLYYTGSRVERIPCDGDAYQRELDYFIDCVRTGRPVDRCSPISSRTSVILAWLERRAVETGRVVCVSRRLAAAWSDQV
jgi:predicted dehydrogenase